MDKIFRNMDRDKDAKLTYEEFVEGSKQDPTIVQVSTLYIPPLPVMTLHKGVITVRRIGVAAEIFIFSSDWQ